MTSHSRGSLAYALGRVRARFGEFLPNERFNELLELTGGESLVRQLKTLPVYGPAAGELSRSDGVSAVLALWSQELAGFYLQLPLPEGLLSWLLEEEEYFNLRCLVRIKLEGWTEIPADLVFSPSVLISVPRLAEFVFHGRRWEIEQSWPEALVDELAEVIGSISAGARPAGIWAEIDRIFLRWHKDQALPAGGRELTDLAAFKIDAYNLQNLLRSRLADGAPSGEAVFLAGGTIPAADWREMGRQDYKALRNFFLGTAWGESLDEALAELAAGGSAWLLLKGIEDFMMSRLAKFRYRIESVLPLVWYWLARKREMTNLRLVMENVLYGLPKEKTRRLLRQADV